MELSVDPRAVESLLAFWADAGVEASYADDPIDRLAEGAALLRARKEAPAPVAVVPAAARAPGRGPEV
ncbi:MAG TPA: uracil-DNA glycosylase, partial [Caulobacter sp.]|nr:uracil-DNA glycosylase [Caulobacter sp.]